VDNVTNLIEASGTREQLISERNYLKQITPSDPLFSTWLQARQKFMEARGWSNGNDLDIYDEDPHTIQVLNLRGQSIEAGLRLTPHRHIEETLSWSWLPDALKQEAQGHLPEVPGGVWDLTRLVPGDVAPERAAQSLIELFGAGYELTNQDDVSPRWVFATTIPFYKYFRQKGIEFTPIIQGRFSPHDKTDSVFCYADPARQTNGLSQVANETHKATYDAVKRGMAAVGTRGMLS
jgi:hypothetical protein